MHSTPKRMSRLVAPALGLALSACHPPGQPQAATGTAPPPASPAIQDVLNLYSGSLTGLVVGAGPDGGNPGAHLPGLSFVPNSGLPQTYIWAFTPDATILDRDCHKITVTQAINIAQAPIANAARFEAGTSTRVQLWAKSGGTPPACGT